MSGHLDDVIYEEPDSDIEFDDTQSQTVESDDDIWSDEVITSEQKRQLDFVAGFMLTGVY
ncbi:hypothetical protein OUZ56_010570 [Daphnia magna]|uniref:Uncharacterized protein n=1 Tax=Daphnia magna TaxID=35525 RepID=A0ABR0AIX5_9CRUS|nr:hypothetical protein OUZ56_010570 [Daphnia magna]